SVFSLSLFFLSVYLARVYPPTSNSCIYFYLFYLSLSSCIYLYISSLKCTYTPVACDSNDFSLLLFLSF
ncbi:hypothetical protein CSUI_011095, partial [Cystoisospora suis]